MIVCFIDVFLWLYLSEIPLPVWKDFFLTDYMFDLVEYITIKRLVQILLTLSLFIEKLC